ncbi:hypothetical protein [Ruminiclostridium josui]|uniref:hypothetical protein n=1 Tax=Ruminiclostridium josui TaxID=1499 RepID=UPI000465CCEF|nr:hypothetical protein [Ruminiclostridium josui]
MKAYQCSKCMHLTDLDETCNCQMGIDPRPNHREKGDSELCKKSFQLLEPEKHWHEKFSWE